MGNELLRDSCPPKRCRKAGVWVECIPVLIAAVIVAFFSGNLLKASGMELEIVVAIGIFEVALLYGFAVVVFIGQKKRMAQTYISICEGGVEGICPKNGYQNRQFRLPYGSITRVEAKGERLLLFAGKEKVILVLNDPASVAMLIRSKLPQ